MPGFPYISFWLNLLLPNSCLICDDQLPHQNPHQVCPSCWERLPLIKHHCSRCGQPYSSFDSGPDPFRYKCGTCRLGDRPYARARSVGLYQGSLRQLIHLFKYHKKSGLGSQLAGWMIKHMPEGFDESDFDYILPVPIHIKRLREREFNQSLILAKSIARRYQRPLMAYNLYRHNFRQPQAQLRQKARMVNVRGAFGVRHPDKLCGKNLLLVDDVYTTGATVTECTKALLKTGAERVEVLTLARTDQAWPGLITT